VPHQGVLVYTRKIKYFEASNILSFFSFRGSDVTEEYHQLFISTL